MYNEFLDFPKDFKFGASTAAYQIEGGFNEDGKGLSIWDEFSSNPKNIDDSHNGNITCDHYHKWKEDLDLMKILGIKSYRFSIAWTRIFPDGTKESYNEKGMKFYETLIKEMIERDITPYVTLFHWDLPLTLQNKGGFANKDTINSFELYAETVIKRLSPLVKNWMTFNEPWVYSYCGHFKGCHAPGIKNLKTTLAVTHNILLSHANIVNFVKSFDSTLKIGIVNNVEFIESASNRPEDIDAANRWDHAFNAWYFDPLFKGCYPEDLVEYYTHHINLNGDIENVMVKYSEEEMKYIQENKGDFVGLNYYTRRIIQYDENDYHLRAKQIYRPTIKRAEFDEWEINPEAFYKLLMKLNDEYGELPFYITENGTTDSDVVVDGCIHDYNRIEYMKRHFAAVHQAIEDGCNIKGFFVWSLLDNYEWAFGFTKRFGIIYTDYEDSCNRIIKDSGHFLANVIRKNGYYID